MLQKKGLVYLDSAATALKPSCVIDAMSHFYQNSYATVHRAAYELSLEATRQYNEVREKVCDFIHATSPDEIVFTRGTTEGLNLIAQCYPIKAGDEIIISGQEHHSNIIPWQLLCEKTGAHLKVIPLAPDGQIDLEKFHALLTPRTKLVSIVHVSNVLGIINPIEKIITAAHAIGAHVVLDAAQSAVHLPINVQALNCDFLVFSSHKLYGPTGVGILYGKKELLQNMPPYQGGG
ncbi:MAG: aminotransferase class V-fold PLP-dependent enzyme, partial [Rhabdochlamydiaceae bacterium]